ncbi:hypothetical protein EST38_g868 [Candolleomyces aberdarensis]|uniref:ubiquitinyl hydrolase 1 n=1 Tax=Candolleomyces aberdarensis TaxID=2316362 RepID=A0A4Q2DZZ6_9AGAR|nr:hypothetical protein EST38_g868 [Candolleomyces aberdarensis]
MAGLEALASTIYHEKQQPGSMLCAQHALNSLLQENYLTAPDLSSIANELDSLEQSVRDEQQAESANMDDTGFFSVQVLDRALKVWGLNLVRWRSEEMKPYHNHPHTQLAFILNLEQHWFTLRRFGPAKPNIEDDPGDGHWFNLNSFLTVPEWVGKLYLGMVLQQAETEGYSVFAVTQADPEGELALPRTLADEIATTLPEPSSAASASTSGTSFQRTMTSASSPSVTQAQSGPQQERFDEEDYELQAALQASLMTNQAMDVDDDDDDEAAVPPPISRRTIPLPASSQSQTPSRSDSASGTHTPQAGAMEEDAELDPVAASMARNQRLLEQMQREQAYAHREIWSEADLTPQEAEALGQRREARRREEEEEEEELRKAIEESERMAREYESKQNRSPKDGGNDDDDDEDEDMEPQPNPSTTAPNLGSSSYYHADRVYDDEDAELQAALKASLEGLPPDFEHPVEVEEPTRPSNPPSQPAPAPVPAPIQSKDREDNASIASTETSITENAPEPEEQLSVDEIRRRRLARFGL